MNNKNGKLILENINTFINKVLIEAENTENLNFFKIEINNHNGTLQMDYQFRERSKIY